LNLNAGYEIWGSPDLLLRVPAEREVGEFVGGGGRLRGPDGVAVLGRRDACALFNNIIVFSRSQ
jgi:hypothetical protein